MTEETEAPQVKDPSKSFRGVMAGALVLEAIVVALALPVVSKLGGGFADGSGWVVLGLVIALIVNCVLLRYRWSPVLAVALQVVMLGCAFLNTALGVLGGIFLLIWVLMLWLRADVARKFAKGLLPAQQQQHDADG